MNDSLENKGIIAEAFENDYSGDQAKAYKIINNIQSNNFSPTKAKFQHPPKKFTPPDNSRSNSSIPNSTFFCASYLNPPSEEATSILCNQFSW